MSSGIEFSLYSRHQYQACLALFDLNCPAFFAPNERADYANFLQSAPLDYHTAQDTLSAADMVCAAYGLTPINASTARINWIMVSPRIAGRGVGANMMRSVLESAQRQVIEHIEIAASQHSAGFFARYGAREIGVQVDGWGEGMHRVDMQLSLR